MRKNIFLLWQIWIRGREMDSHFCIALIFLALRSVQDGCYAGWFHTSTLCVSMSPFVSYPEEALAPVGRAVLERVSSSIFSPPQSWDFSRNQKSLTLLGARELQLPAKDRATSGTWNFMCTKMKILQSWYLPVFTNCQHLLNPLHIS